MNRLISRTSWVSATLGISLLTGCSALIDESSPEYQRARQVERLELPPDLNAPNTTNTLPAIITEQASAEDLKNFEKFQEMEKFDEFSRYQAWKEQRSDDERLDFEAFQLAKRANDRSSRSGAGVKLETNFDNSIDIRIDANPDDSFGYVGAALVNMNVFVSSSEPDNYRFVTELPELKTRKISLPGASRFAIQLNRDLRDTLVTLLDNRSQKVVTPAGQTFQSRLASQIRVAKLRAELANQVDRAADLAGELRNDESGHLLLDLEIDRNDVYNQIDYVLDQIGFTVVERDAEQTRILVRFETETLQSNTEKTGLSRLKFWDRDKKQSISGVYAITVEPLAGGSRVRVTDESNETGAVGDDIIELIREKL